MSEVSVLNRMSEAEYLVQQEPYWRLIMRFLYRQHKAHIHYVHSIDILKVVKEVIPDYDIIACHRHLDNLVNWKLIREVPTQSKPSNLFELKNLPRIYQAERIAIRLEGMRVELEEEGNQAAALNPTVLEQFVQRLNELVDHTANLSSKDTHKEWEETYRRWHSAIRTFTDMARTLEDYLSDLPRHRPKETLDIMGFLDYRDIISKYLSMHIERIYQRKDFISHQLSIVYRYIEEISIRVATISSEQVRSDGTSFDFENEKLQCLHDMEGMASYFTENGDVSIMLRQAEDWIEEITSQARRLSEQHLFSSTVREQTLLDLAEQFINLPLEQAQWLGQVTFGVTLPLHWRGEQAIDDDTGSWKSECVDVILHSVKRGSRQKTAYDTTNDRSQEQLERMAAEYRMRENAAKELENMFGDNKTIVIDNMKCKSPEERQQILRLIYRALSEEGRTRVGYKNWYVTLETSNQIKLGKLNASDGTLTMPSFTLKLFQGGE